MTAEIKTIIKENRPTLTDSSVRTYASTLFNLHKRIYGSAFSKGNFLNDYEEVLDFLKDKEPKTRKTVLSALVVFSDGHKKAQDAYPKQMVDDQEKTDVINKKQMKDEKQEANWMSYDEILRCYSDLEKTAKPLFSKEKFTMNDLQKIQDYIILSLYTLQAPRRLKDYVDFKIKNIDKEKDNYFDKKTKKLVFNSYKTAKFYKKQEVEANPKLMTLLNKWFQINPTEWLLFDNNQKQLTSPQLTRRLNSICGRKVSVNMIRHAYISDRVLKDVPALSKLEQTAEEMGHSVQEQMLYKKK